jgi:hypothetical protein
VLVGAAVGVGVVTEDVTGATIGVLVLPSNTSTSSAIILPWGPLPRTLLRSTLLSFANFLARGEITLRPLRLLGLSAGGAALAATGSGAFSGAG